MSALTDEQILAVFCADDSLLYQSDSGNVFNGQSDYIDLREIVLRNARTLIALAAQHSNERPSVVLSRDGYDILVEKARRFDAAEAAKAAGAPPKTVDCTCGAASNAVHSEDCPVTHMVRAAFAVSGESANADSATPTARDDSWQAIRTRAENALFPQEGKS